jgi:hypothetical protein
MVGGQGDFSRRAIGDDGQQIEEDIAIRIAAHLGEDLPAGDIDGREVFVLTIDLHRAEGDAFGDAEIEDGGFHNQASPSSARVMERTPSVVVMMRSYQSSVSLSQSWGT